MRKLVAVCVVVFLTVGHLVGAEPGVKLKVNHTVVLAPVELVFTVTIEPNADNRKACLAIDGGEAHLSCWQVDGDKHPRTEWKRRRIGTAGEYFAVLTVVSVVGNEVKHTTATTQFLVEEPGVPFVR